MRFDDERELPREVIEARAQVVHNVANQYADAHGRCRIDSKAHHIVARLRVYFWHGGITCTVLKLPKGVIQRFQVLTGPVQFCFGAIHGRKHDNS